MSKPADPTSPLHDELTPSNDLVTGPACVAIIRRFMGMYRGKKTKSMTIRHLQSQYHWTKTMSFDWTLGI